MLTDRQEVQKQQEQLKALAERREQLEFMLEWRKELNNLTDYEIKIVENEIRNYTDTFTLSQTGRNRIKVLIQEFSLNPVLESIGIAFTKYYNETDKEHTWNFAFDKIGGICYNKRGIQNNPAYSLFS